MDILAAVFVEGINQRQAPGPATRIDLTGVMFSLQAPSAPPVTLSPHLVVLLRCRPEENGQGTLEVEFLDSEGKQVARNVQPVAIEPGKFGRQLVKGELAFEGYGTIEAHCHITGGNDVVVPLTLLPAPA
ncbi:MAG: hypothetical protein ACRD2W_06360 [Acidimicrobiales bacterium]